MLSRDSLETRIVFLIGQASLSLVRTVAFVGTGNKPYCDRKEDVLPK